ncbi:hypothetical protein ABFV05_010375 [Capra hircus]
MSSQWLQNNAVAQAGVEWPNLVTPYATEHWSTYRPGRTQAKAGQSGQRAGGARDLGSLQGGLVQQASPGPPPRRRPGAQMLGKAIGSRRPSPRPSPAAPCGPEAPCGSHHSPPPAGSSRPSEAREGKKKNPPHAGSPPCQHGSHADSWRLPLGTHAETDMRASRRWLRCSPRPELGEAPGGSGASGTQVPSCDPRISRVRGRLCWLDLPPLPPSETPIREGAQRLPGVLPAPALPDSLLRPCFLYHAPFLSPSCGNHHLRKLSLSVSPPPSFSFFPPTAFYPGAAWQRRALGAGPRKCGEAWRPEPGVPEASAQRLERWPAALALACLIPLPGPSPPHPSQRLGWRLGMDLERGARWWW